MGESAVDVYSNLYGNTPFASIVSECYSRRQTMGGGVASLTTAGLSTSLLAACDDDKEGGSPNVDAGQDAQTNSGRVVALTGTTGGDPDSAGWEQVSGPEVVLTNAEDRKSTRLNSSH